MRVILICAVAAALTGCATREASPLDAAVQRCEARLQSYEAADDGPGQTGQIDHTTVMARRGRTWLCAAAADEKAGAAPPSRKRPTAPGWGKGADGEIEYVPWPQRVGRAYPTHFWPSLGRWGKEMPATLWDDAKSTVTNRTSLVVLGLAGIAGAAIASSDLDDRVEDHYTRHGSQLSKGADGIGGFLGNPSLHLPAAFVSVIVATANGDDEFYENQTTLLNALCVNGIIVQGLKWGFRSESPNGDEMGWPSGHASSSFCLATVMYHQHGPWVGVPLLGFATFVAYQRVDARNHDFSDVVSGSLIGIAIGHAVASNHELRLLGMDVVPYVHPETGAVGVALTTDW